MSLVADPLLAEWMDRSSLTPEARAALRNEARAAETEIKFAGYLEQQKKSIAKLKAAEGLRFPSGSIMASSAGFRGRCADAAASSPVTIGQASRLPGVTPAALSLGARSIRLQGPCDRFIVLCEVKGVIRNADR